MRKRLGLPAFIYLSTADLCASVFVWACTLESLTCDTLRLHGTQYSWSDPSVGSIGLKISRDLKSLHQRCHGVRLLFLSFVSPSLPFPRFLFKVCPSWDDCPALLTADSCERTGVSSVSSSKSRSSSSSHIDI